MVPDISTKDIIVSMTEEVFAIEGVTSVKKKKHPLIEAYFASAAIPFPTQITFRTVPFHLFEKLVFESQTQVISRCNQNIQLHLEQLKDNHRFLKRLAKKMEQVNALERKRIEIIRRNT